MSLLLVLLAGVGGALPWSEEPARLSVEVLGGFATAQSEPGRAVRVGVLLDARESMQASGPEGVRRFDAAQSAADRFLDALPADHAVSLRVLGDEAAACAPAREVARAAPGSDRAGLHEAVSSADPRGDGSLAQALAAFVVVSGVSQVVVFSDLGPDCGGDLCATAARLAEAGAGLDLVVLGGAEVPACVSDANGAVERPSREAGVPVPATYRVFVVDAEEPISVGRIGGEPIVLEAAEIEIEIELDPPARLGPIELRPGGWTRFRVLEFPGLTPPVREWRWETEGGDTPAETP